MQRTGIINLEGGKTPTRDNTCISGYERGKPNFALSNFAEPDGNPVMFKTKGGKPAFQFQDPDIGPVNFPTSEHYLHFQQLSKAAKEHMLKQGYADTDKTDILRGKQDPNNKWYMGGKLPNGQNVLSEHASINGVYFDTKWVEHSKNVQMQINAAKYQQSPGFRASIDEAIALGKQFGDSKGAATIIEDTSSLSSGKKPEKLWGTGPKGDGENRLGNSQTAFANYLMNNPDEKSALANSTNNPSLANFSSDQHRELHEQAANQFKDGVQVALKAVRAGFTDTLGQPDTNDIAGVTKYDNTQAVGLAMGNAANTLQAETAPNPSITNPDAIEPAPESSAPENSVALAPPPDAPKTVNLSDPAQLEKIQTALKSVGWGIKDSVSGDSVTATNASGTSKIDINNNGVHVYGNDNDALKAGFTAFEATFGTVPFITCSNPKQIEKALQAYRELYGNDKTPPTFIRPDGSAWDLDQVKKLDPATLATASAETANTITASTEPVSPALETDAPIAKTDAVEDKTETVTASLDTPAADADTSTPEVTPPSASTDETPAAVEDKTETLTASLDTPAAVADTSTLDETPEQKNERILQTAIDEYNTQVDSGINPGIAEAAMRETLERELDLLPAEFDHVLENNKSKLHTTDTLAADTSTSPESTIPESPPLSDATDEAEASTTVSPPNPEDTITASSETTKPADPEPAGSKPADPEPDEPEPTTLSSAATAPKPADPEPTTFSGTAPDADTDTNTIATPSKAADSGPAPETDSSVAVENPPEEHKAVTTEEDRPNKNTHPINLAKIKEELGNSWKVPESVDRDMPEVPKYAEVKNGNSVFHVTATQFIPQTHDEKTYEAVLSAHKAVHGASGREPNITCETEKQKEMMLKAYAKVYPGKEPPEINVVPKEEKKSNKKVDQTPEPELESGRSGPRPS